MPNTYIRTVSGGENTNPAATEGIPLDSGTDSTWTQIANLHKNMTQGTTTQAGTIELATNAEALTGTDTARAMTPANVRAVLETIPDGTMFNGKISPTVSSNDLVLTLTTNSGGTPSSTDPVYIKINGTVRSVTSALSVTLADGTNWFDSGGSRYQTLSRDYFAYASWRASSSAVVLGHSPIPYATLYSDFNATSTNERYGAFSTAPASSDDVVVIGRFSATLSAGAGYTWTVPTYTSETLIQKPIYETRVLTWNPTYTNLTVGNGSVEGKYVVSDKEQKFYTKFIFGSTSSISGALTADLPFTIKSSGGIVSMPHAFIQILDSGTALYVGQAYAGTDQSVIQIRVLNASATYTTLTAISSTVPMTWATNDECDVQGWSFIK